MGSCNISVSRWLAQMTFSLTELLAWLGVSAVCPSRPRLCGPAAQIESFGLIQRNEIKLEKVSLCRRLPHCAANVIEAR